MAQPPNPKKRKDAPSAASQHQSKRPKPSHQRNKQRDARQLSTQLSSRAFKNGELDVSSFVRSREFEIRALEEGMARSKKALNRRAFQQVPKELRRRTASHDVKRVVKRLRERGRREMVEDNTPTVTARRRKPTGQMRLRLETAKKLRALGARKKAERQEQKDEEGITVRDPATTTSTAPNAAVSNDKTASTTTKAIKTRAPKVKKSTLATSPVPKAKFRKRQISKSWLPTHLFHAKRAHMTPPSAPLWRFSIPLTPTVKSYRPTHRAGRERGAVAWDMSYMSTIGLEGREESIIGMLGALGVSEETLTGKKAFAEKWRKGLRVLETELYEREEGREMIAPVTIIWCAPVSASGADRGKRKRKVFLRVHPAAFFQLWEEIVRLGKVAKPAVSVEDLRFEIGSIEITGPGATEALLGTLWPSPASTPTSTVVSDGKAGEQDPASAAAGAGVDALNIEKPNDRTGSTAEETWSVLAGLNNPSLLPVNALIAFNIQDPRLHHPPRTIKLPKPDADQTALLETLASWPPDTAPHSEHSSADLFSREKREKARRGMASQKAINRRKALAPPGQYPEPLPKDPRIPVMLYTSTSSIWTLLLPRATVQATWYTLLYYPLSTGQQPRFGGLREKRQLAFEAGQPWFPGDFPGSKGGWEWEMQERKQREDEWRRRPKGKRVAFEKVELGGGKAGEVGVGWACEWERLLGGGEEMARDSGGGSGKEDGKTAAEAGATAEHADAATMDKDANKDTAAPAPPKALPKPAGLIQLPTTQSLALLHPPPNPTPTPAQTTALTAVRLTLLTRGVPQTCARIYRLPSTTTNNAQRKAWLALLPSHIKPNKAGPKHSLPRLSNDLAAHEKQRILARSLIEPTRAGEDGYPACPGEEDLIGYVTTGNFNLAEGKGTGVGCIVLSKVLEEVRRETGDHGRMCVVRNAGESVGRLARWDVV